MSKKVLVQAIQPVAEGPLYGQQQRVQDLIKAQQYAHEHIEAVTHDFLVSNQYEVAGFDWEIINGANITFRVKLPGRIYGADGRAYDLAAQTDAVVPAANDDPRVDVVFATVEADVAAESISLPFIRVRTQTELEAGTPPYPPTQFNQPTERHHRAVVQLRAGTPGATPVPPTLASNEVALYYLVVGAGITELRPVDVLDQRQLLLTLRGLNTGLSHTQRDLASLAALVNSLPSPLAIQVFLKELSRTMALQEVLALLVNKRDYLAMPEILTPALARTHPDSGKIGAVGGVDAGTPVVDLPVGMNVVFGDSVVTVDPRLFPQELNARLVQTAGGGATVQRQNVLNLANVTLLEGDGQTDFVQRAAVSPVKRSRAAIAARDSRYLEIFGGLSEFHSSALGDWFTYDTVNDTATPRTLAGDTIPSCSRPAMATCGDQTHVLAVCPAPSTPSGPTGVARWFRVNAVTGASSEYTGTLPDAEHFIADAIAPNLVFIVGLSIVAGLPVQSYWAYDVDTETFTELTVSGSAPNLAPDHFAGCFYRLNQFVLVGFTPKTAASGKTYVFDYPTLSWTMLTTPAPYGGGPTEQSPLSRFRLANVGGRPMLAGGLQPAPGGSRVWTLGNFAGDPGATDDTDVATWQSHDTGLPALNDAAFASLVPDLEQEAKGQAVVIGGESAFGETFDRIYQTSRGGLLETTFQGQPALTLAPAASFARFVLAGYAAPWQIASLFARLHGEYTLGQIRLEYSFNGGGDWHDITPDKPFTVTDSSNPGQRRVRVTLYSYKTSKPVVGLLEEVFTSDGVFEGRYVLRFNSSTAGARALHVERTGLLTYGTDLSPSTPDRAILLKTVPNGPSSAPTVTQYVNKRHTKLRLTGAVGGSQPSVANPLASAPLAVATYGVRAANGDIYLVATPTVAFDTAINLSGLAPGDTYLLDLET
jgi:hypothetical protein